MFSLSIVDTDLFLEMPVTSRLLYYELGMRADDDGFVDNWKKIMRMTGLSEDDVKILIAKKFILVFESGVIVIRHWRLNNYLRNDRRTPTRHKKELEQLYLEDDVYELESTEKSTMLPDGIPVDDTGKDRIGNNIYEQKNEGELSKDEKLEHNFGVLWNEYPKKKGKAQAFKHYKGIVRANKLSNQQMLGAIRRYKEYLEEQKIQDQYVMYGSTFFCSGIYDYLGDEEDD